MLPEVPVAVTFWNSTLLATTCKLESAEGVPEARELNIAGSMNAKVVGSVELVEVVSVIEVDATPGAGDCINCALRTAVVMVLSIKAPCCSTSAIDSCRIRAFARAKNKLTTITTKVPTIAMYTRSSINVNPVRLMRPRCSARIIIVGEC